MLQQKYIYNYILLLIIILTRNGNADEDVRYYFLNEDFCSIELECFNERPKDEDIVDFTWHINDYDFNENVIASYSEVSGGKKKGDIYIESTEPLANNSIAKCAATVQEAGKRVTLNREYRLREGVLPSFSETTQSHNSQAQEGLTKVFKCEVMRATPPPTIKLYFDGEEKASNTSLVAEFRKQIVLEDDNKTVKCVAISPCNRKIELFTTLKVEYKPRKLGATEEKPEAVGKPYILKLRLKSYPDLDAYNWYRSSECSGKKTKISSPDEQFIIEHQKTPEKHVSLSTIKLENVTASHLNTCLTLEVSNEIGTESFQYTISLKDSGMRIFTRRPASSLTGPTTRPGAQQPPPGSSKGPHGPDENGFPTMEVVLGTSISLIILILVGSLAFCYRSRLKKLCHRGPFSDYELSRNN